LGVKLDETLNWDEHIEMVCKKVGAGIGILKRIKPYVPANTLISNYNALIQPYFDYCSPFWGVCNKTKRWVLITIRLGFVIIYLNQSSERNMTKR
jgi:hypothetical protein